MLELAGITKRFGDRTALDHVSLGLRPGEIHAVLGENGAGKSTLMRILYGLLQPDAGEIRLRGRPLRLRRPADAHAAGIGMVHQHFMLVDEMTVAENIALGRRDAGFWRSPAESRRRAREAAARWRLDVDVDRRVESLSVGERQRVEILKALLGQVATLILDEPTAVLTAGEVDQLFSSLAELRAAGRGIFFISHRLAEITSLCDRVSVLRAGRLVCSEPVGALTSADLAERMVGRRPATTPRPRRAAVQPPPAAVAELEAVATAGPHDRLTHASLRIGRGEFIAVVGVEGNGQQALTRVLLGLEAPTSGRVTMTLDRAGDSLRRRVAFIANDRLREALAPDLTLTENAILRDHAAPPLSRLGWLHVGRQRRFAAGILRTFDVRASSPDGPAAALSGGNQQKLIVGREMAGGPGLVLACNPTRGLDVAASEFVQDRLTAAAAAGAGVLLVTADLDEALRLADRLFVLYSGRLTFVPGPPFDIAVVGRLMAGLTATGPAA